MLVWRRHSGCTRVAALHSTVTVYLLPKNTTPLLHTKPCNGGHFHKTHVFCGRLRCWMQFRNYTTSTTTSVCMLAAHRHRPALQRRTILLAGGVPWVHTAGRQ